MSEIGRNFGQIMTSHQQKISNKYHSTGLWNVQMNIQQPMSDGDRDHGNLEEEVSQQQQQDQQQQQSPQSQSPQPMSHADRELKSRNNNRGNIPEYEIERKMEEEKENRERRNLRDKVFALYDKLRLYFVWFGGC